MPRTGEYFYDLHVHTSRHSPCSAIAPEDAIAAARARGLDGIALTEHEYLWPLAEIEDLKARAGCPSFPVLAGCEISTQSDGRRTGDVLVFGAGEIPEKSWTLDEICLAVHSQGGVVIAAHPYAPLIGVGDDVKSAMVDAIEIANHRYLSPEATRQLEETCRELQIPAIAASDAHAVGNIGRFCVGLDEMVLTAEELVRVILEGRCKPCLHSPPGILGRFLRRL
jgi:hypothetical protein